MTKVCTRCKQEKPVSEYKMKEGKPTSRCKVCIRELAKIRRDKLKAAYAMPSAKHGASPELNAVVASWGKNAPLYHACC